MAELMLVNPRKRRKSRKPRSAAQRAATRKLVARNKRRRNPAPARRRAASRTSVVKRRRTPARSVVARKRRYKRNPNGRGMAGIVNTTLIPAAVAATGALSLDVLWNFLPLPVALKTGPLRHIAKGAGAIGLGWLAGMVVNKKTAGQLATGALTVVTYNAMREMMARFMPAVNMGYYSAGMPAGEMGAYVGMGEYVGNGNNGMGAYIGGGGTSPYLAADTLSEPFAGPSAAQVDYAKGVKVGAALETEQNMGSYY
jgi:hypothetical protein